MVSASFHGVREEGDSRERSVCPHWSDEFCLILKDCPQEVAYSKLYWIQYDFAKQAGKPYEKNFSFGIVRLPAGHGPVDLEKLLHDADHAMYQQKRTHYLAQKS